jgi:DMSO/TMAO reductase YedYZ molybdopterin-dependent catalytic subunit
LKKYFILHGRALQRLSKTAPPAASGREPLPPGQVWGRKFIIYAAKGVQHVDPKEWRLEVTGLVKTPLIFGYDEFMGLPMKSYSKTFHCLLPGGMVYASPLPTAIENVKEGMEVVGTDGHLHRVSKLVRRTHEGKVVGIKASYLPPERMTPDHPVWTVAGHTGPGGSKSKRRSLTFREGWKPEWKRADDLRVGDYVFFPKYRHVSYSRQVEFQGPTLPIDEKLANLLGRYVAEGSGGESDGRATAFSLNSMLTAHGRELMELIEDVSGPGVGDDTNDGVTLLRVVAARTMGERLHQSLREWCGTGAPSKHIPGFIMDAEPPILRSFLVSYLRAGAYSKEASGDEREDLIDLDSSSKVLTYQLLLALSKLGIPGEVVNHPGAVRTGFSVRVRGQKIRNLLPDFSARARVNRFHYKETEDGFYYPIRKIWAESYSGVVYDFQAPPTYTMLSPFVTQDCVTSWSIEKPLWEGVPIKYLADAAEVKPEAKWVMFHCYDGYTAPIPVEDALKDDSIVAMKMNGRPLSAEQGFPARPFIPNLYAWKSAKWLGKIEFIPEYADGYWEAYGYHERGDVDAEERFKGSGDAKHYARRAFGTA